MAKYGILVDMNLCIGCKACALSCKEVNNIPIGVSWLEVKEEVRSNGASVELYTFPMGCLHCAEPSCAKVCPVKAITKEKDGTVQRDSEKCVGCRYCVSACPFGQSHFDESSNKAEKCNLCIDRQAKGEAPACTVNCPTQARKAISLDKLKEEAAKRIAEAKKLGKSYQLFAGENVGGTQVAYIVPSGVYLSDGPEDRTRSTAVAVWQDMVKPVAKVGLGGVVGAVVVAGALITIKKGE